MIYDLVDEKNEILKTPTENFDFENPPIDPIELSINLAETMITHKGLGLAAPQCGLPYRVFVVNSKSIFAVFNPKIVDMSVDTVYMEEGCLTFPNTYIKVKRPSVIRIRYQQPNGEFITQEWAGLTARIFQHEYDHLEGLTYKDRATKWHIDTAYKKKAKFKL